MDEVDLALVQSEKADEARIEGIREAAANISKGHPGECDKCGDFSERLVERRHFARHGRPDIAARIESGICPRCRDAHKLP